MNKTEDNESDSPVKRGNSGYKRKEKARTSTKNIVEILGKNFTRKILSGIRLKLYNFSETEAQIKQKRDFKSEFTLWYKDKLELYTKKNANADDAQALRA